ncbi:MAG TPA: ribosomal protein S18-alanine N-acetyltransferase [Candidatus Sulfopaludibacter sp.]|jgi:ribosomal-protein-alanine N-acetyltransferase|nr:ribosomal protein S18-alanine N-acetyltransferase [Candidatus Sulfopaludibacter sp.]
MPIIRRGRDEDFGQIAEIQAASPEGAHWEVAGYAAYDLWVADWDNRVAGFLATRQVAEGEGEILNLAVCPEFRRKGLGKALLTAYLEQHPGLIFLEVRESNLAARKLYKSIGFKEIGVRPAYYDDPSEAAIVLKFHSC